MIRFCFSAGDENGKNINYLYTCDDDERWADERLPYAQIEVPEELLEDPVAVEEYGYFPCKEEIIRQCSRLGIKKDELSFFWDDCEKSLSEYAKMGEGDVKR